MGFIGVFSGYSTSYTVYLYIYYYYYRISTHLHSKHTKNTKLPTEPKHFFGISKKKCMAFIERLKIGVESEVRWGGIVKQ